MHSLLFLTVNVQVLLIHIVLARSNIYKQVQAGTQCACCIPMHSSAGGCMHLGFAYSTMHLLETSLILTKRTFSYQAQDIFFHISKPRCTGSLVDELLRTADPKRQLPLSAATSECAGMPVGWTLLLLQAGILGVNVIGSLVEESLETVDPERQPPPSAAPSEDTEASPKPQPLQNGHAAPSRKPTLKGSCLKTPKATFNARTCRTSLELTRTYHVIPTSWSSHGRPGI